MEIIFCISRNDEGKIYPLKLNSVSNKAANRSNITLIEYGYKEITPIKLIQSLHSQIKVI